MKKHAFIPAVTLFLMMTFTTNAQTSVTGHAFAEVIESVSASTQLSSFSVQKNQAGSIAFGLIDIKSSASASCSLLLGKANLTGCDMQQITMETSASGTRLMEGNAINGFQSIYLECKAGSDMPQMSASSYQGAIDIVLAYN